MERRKRGPRIVARAVVDLPRPRTLDVAETIRFSRLAGAVHRHLNASGAID
jgi:hypothetical protein